ncbi:hypothetical protein NEISUBOT_05564 [Neisseria subflava NJ9703]|uniref:Uncharacterized protein n=1 Tax=Neisseria subflava NJ9703 TaxID=546268 RepID=A0A9W5INM2_NEISU|nr:hypothetical protein NEISUBOT_05564 [Neisseria subflava NJ9703]
MCSARWAALCYKWKRGIIRSAFKISKHKQKARLLSQSGF